MVLFWRGPRHALGRRAVGLALAFVAFGALVSLAACGGHAVYNWKAESALGYRVGPGDVLKISVWKHEELSQQVTVRPDGKFSLALVGDIDADGHSVDEIGADIFKRSARFFQD